MKINYSIGPKTICLPYGNMFIESMTILARNHKSLFPLAIGLPTVFGAHHNGVFGYCLFLYSFSICVFFFSSNIARMCVCVFMFAHSYTMPYTLPANLTDLSYLVIGHCILRSHQINEYKISLFVQLSWLFRDMIACIVLPFSNYSLFFVASSTSSSFYFCLYENIDGVGWLCCYQCCYTVFCLFIYSVLWDFSMRCSHRDEPSSFHACHYLYSCKHAC